MPIGAHVSVAGGVEHAVDRQRTIGGTCGQIFTHAPQIWAHTSISDAQAEAFRTATEAHLDGAWLIHTSYLVNLSTPKPNLRRKSIQSMQQELDTAARLGIPYVNVHAGAHTGAGVEAGLQNAVSALDALDVPERVTILIETDAGSGTKLGARFEELAHLLRESTHALGICLDTAHVFAAGYDLSTPDAVDATVQTFDDVIGLAHLHAIHLNDSKHDCGTHRDEHAHIGEGCIGMDGMQRLVTHPALRDLPYVLETPNTEAFGHADNIERVRQMRASASPLH
ncbi:MAG: deoxyribonuclease IV [Longimonas sp.]|uniref:deoxyribonuclease IV n=1 Tax=Longimonas sp. TaxID=2039626 RepID=UPI003976E509